MNGDPPVERRKMRRFLADGGCLISFGQNPIKLWQVIDIHKEGLAFRYIGGAEDTQSASRLDILTRDTSLCIEKIPFQVVSDLQMPGPRPRRYPLKRCSVRFIDITDEQTGLLETLIKGYTNSTRP